MFENRLISSVDSDIFVALAIMVLLSLALFFAAYWLSRKLGTVIRTVIIAGLIAVAVLFRVYLFDSIIILKLLPFENTIIYGNLVIPLVAITSGVFLQSKKIPLWRRLLFSFIILAMAFRPTYLQLMAEKPETKNIWRLGVCMQTTDSTCGAASAATLLKCHGINASEVEMVEKCLTSNYGSFNHGIYRGLKKKVDGTKFDVVADSCSLEQLQNDVVLPAIVVMRLTRSVNKKDPRYSKVWGWHVNVSHVVIIKEFTDDGQVLVMDPARGNETWGIQGVKDLWQGGYITLVPREN